MDQPRPAKGREDGRLCPFVGPLELTHLTFRFLASNSVMLLDLTNELVALTLDDLPVIVGQSTPLLLGLSDELLPVSLYLIAVHSKCSTQLTLACQQRV